MSKAKAVLIIGGSGFVGTHLALRLRETYKVFATYRRHRVPIPGVTMVPMGLENREWAKRIVYMAQPDVIVYAAGSDDPAWNEANSRDCEHLHTGGAATISGVSDILQPTFIYLSNPYVFDGARGNYHENDIVLPTTTLGKGKLGGENYIKSKSLSYVLVRSSPLIGRGNGVNLSMLDRLRQALHRGNRLEIPDTDLHNFAPVEGLMELIARIIDTNAEKKIFHYGGLTKVTHYEFARRFAERFGYDSKLIAPLRGKAKPGHGGAPVFQDYSLNSTQTVEALKIEPLFLEQGFDLIEKNLIAGS